MTAVTYDVTYMERRNRLTTLLRYFLAIPHMIVAACGGTGRSLSPSCSGSSIVFTGQRNEGMWRFQRSYIGYPAG